MYLIDKLRELVDPLVYEERDEHGNIVSRRRGVYSPKVKRDADGNPLPHKPPPRNP